MGTEVELDDYARDAYLSFVEASDAIAAAEQRRDKAKEALITFMSMAEADEATLDGEPVLQLADVHGLRFDSKRFQIAEPYKYREYSKPYAYARLTRLRRTL
jgi:hypothetical protein